MKTDFYFRGLHCHLNNNHIWPDRYDYTYTPRYILLLYRGNAWIRETCVDTKKEALQYLKNNYIYIVNR